MAQKSIGRSKEDYLKAILKVKKKYGACRSVDVSNEMGVSKSSVCIAIKKLEQDGFVTRDDWRIVLTDNGQQLAENLYEKNRFFLEWFKTLGVSEKTAEADACMVEHAISEETYHMMRKHLTKAEKP